MAKIFMCSLYRKDNGGAKESVLSHIRGSRMGINGIGVSGGDGSGLEMEKRGTEGELEKRGTEGEEA